MAQARMHPPPKNGTVPNPDPTERTVDQLQHEISTSREIVEAQAKGARDVLETRLGGMDKAIELLQRATDRIPQYVKDTVAHLESLHQEKFHSITSQMDTRFDGISTQFLERDKRTEQLSLSDKTAINAALAAQEKQAIAQNDSNSAANVKMETNFSELIKQGQTLLLEVRRNTESQINDLKSRLDKGEGGTRGSDKANEVAAAAAQATAIATAAQSAAVQAAAVAAAARSSAVISQIIAGVVAFVVVVTAIAGTVAFVSASTRAGPQVNIPR